MLSRTCERGLDNGASSRPRRGPCLHLRRVALVLLAVLLVPCGEALGQAAARVDTRVSADSVRIGERFTVTLTAEHAADTEVIFPTPREETSRLFGDLRVIRRSEIQQRRGTPGRRVDSVDYEVTTFSLDSARVPPLPLRVVAGADTTRLHSSSRIVPVISVVDEEAKGLRDPAALASFPRPLWAWAFLGLVVSALLAGLAYVWWQRQQDDSEPVAQQVETERQSPYEVAATQLRRLQQEDGIHPEDVKAFYVDLADILRTYLSRELGVAALERTTSELIETLDHRPDVSTEAVGRIQAVLELADLVKFADTRPAPEDNRQALQQTRAAIDAVRTTPRSAQGTPAEEPASPA